ncbi:FAD-dependent oxidoreductase [Bacillaceae bacterium IKA-2]|nr:FAD-dependent oxidoreductase [Bacillaceae bacterium IKA-2]
MMNKVDVIIVGGGLAGIMAANTLKEAGVNDVLIVEKGKSVGGRLATRRVGGGKADHGTQFFTAFTDLFNKQALNWHENGWTKKWFGGTHPRYYCVSGMNGLASMLAEGLNTKLNTKVISVHEGAQGFHLKTDKEELQAKALIMTAPMPQIIELLKTGNIELKTSIKEVTEAIEFSPCLVAIVELDQPSNLDSLGYADSKLPNGIDRIVDHQKKGISSTAILSIYMTGEWSKENFAREDEQVLANVLELISDKYLNEAKVVSIQLKKWRYSEAVRVVNQPFLNAELSFPLIFAGDAFLAPNDPSKRARLETAAISGIAAGKEMTKLL